VKQLKNHLILEVIQIELSDNRSIFVEWMTAADNLCANMAHLTSPLLARSSLKGQYFANAI
jgi:hypothetical protein